MSRFSYQEQPDMLIIFGRILYKDLVLNNVDLKTPSIHGNNSEFGAKGVNINMSMTLMFCQSLSFHMKMILKVPKVKRQYPMKLSTVIQGREEDLFAVLEKHKGSVRMHYQKFSVISWQ